MGEATMAATKRLGMELSKVCPRLKPGFSAGPKGDNMLEWNAVIPGPAGTPFEGGVYELQLAYPPDYPFKPPGITFVTPPYHPNFNENGTVCLDLITNAWAPSVKINLLLEALYNLLADPQPGHALSVEIAEEYVNNRPVWE